MFPIGLPGPEALAELTGEIQEARPADNPFDVVVDITPGDDTEPWAQAGATWIVTDFGMQPTKAGVREVSTRARADRRGGNPWVLQEVR